uniref:Uncharacterized protein n=1 Tax=Knipowitschia caucasica TaxID=637954 RepID=A0AAV2LQP7_KNICA
MYMGPSAAIAPVLFVNIPSLILAVRWLPHQRLRGPPGATEHAHLQYQAAAEPKLRRMLTASLGLVPGAGRSFGHGLKQERELQASNQRSDDPCGVQSSLCHLAWTGLMRGARSHMDTAL